MALNWTKTSWWKSSYVLSDGDTQVGSLDLRWHGEAAGTFGAEAYTFKSLSYWKRDFAAFRASDGAQVAKFAGSCWKSGGEFTFGSRVLRLNSCGSRSCELLDADVTLLKMKRQGWSGKKFDVELSSAFADDPDQAAAILFLSYVTLKAQEAASGADAGVIAATS